MPSYNGKLSKERKNYQVLVGSKHKDLDLMI